MNIYLLRHGQTNLNRDGKYQGALVIYITGGDNN
jgi:broad specificity phosphatase PhoE